MAGHCVHLCKRAEFHEMSKSVRFAVSSFIMEIELRLAQEISIISEAKTKIPSQYIIR